MIHIKKSTIRKDGSCNFCARGSLTELGTSLFFPYTLVYVLSGNRLSVTICSDCLKELKKVKP